MADTMRILSRRPERRWIESRPELTRFTLGRACRLCLSIACCAIVGCESASTRSSSFPQPNFAGPVVLEQPKTVITKAAPVQPLKKPSDKPLKTDRSVPAEWTPNKDAVPRDWKWIVIHHSATPTGGAKAFDIEHRKKWDELGYHFVIGNGTDTPDGLVEVGSRWPVQKHGAHAKSPDNRFNEHGIGICLVGNFDITRPTAKQTASLVKLVAFLSTKYRIANSDIIGHNDTGKQTDCPGTNMDLAAIRTAVQRAQSTKQVK